MYRIILRLIMKGSIPVPTFAVCFCSSKFRRTCVIGFFFRLHEKSEDKTHKGSIAAVMEGKLKEKLESMGIACLCLAQANFCAASSTC